MPYQWRFGADWGGGYQMNIVASRQTAGHAFAGGDLWGLRTSSDQGSSWQGCMLGISISTGSGTNGIYSRAGVESKKTPGTWYVGIGGLHSGVGTGYFGRVVQSAGTLTQASSSGTYGFGTNQAGSPAAVRPRAGGDLILVDYDGTTEYVYALIAKKSSGDFRVARSTNAGDTFTDLWTSGIGSGGAWKSGCLYQSSGGSFPDSLLVGSYRDTTTDNNASPSGTVVTLITAGSASIRAATGSAQLTISTVGSAPGVVESICQDPVTGSIYAACGPYGIYSVPNDGSAWTKMSGTFFNQSWVSSIDGRNGKLYACCVNTGGRSAGANTVAASTDGGATWTWVTNSTLTHGTSGKINSVPWGTTNEWWLVANGAPNFNNRLGGSSFDAQQLSVDQMDTSGNTVYVCGSAGTWLSKDGGATWRPAVIGVNGGEVSLVVPGIGGNVSANNHDYTQATSTDHLATCTRSSTTLSGTANASLAAQKDGAGNTYTITTTSGAPDIKKNGASIATPLFKSSVFAIADFKVSNDGYVYLGQFGGGTFVGDPNGVIDTNPPTAPTTISAVAQNPTTIQVSWSGATDDVGVVGYQLWRQTSGGAFSQIASPSSSPYTDGTCVASTTYGYYIIALDAAGNTSPQSATATATTPSSGSGDVTPPSTPTGLTATANGSTSINLSWTASTDNVAVAGYQVLRGGSQIATTTVTSYADSGLTPSTSYTYTVKAFDAAGNISTASTSATATTSASSAVLIGTTTTTSFTDQNLTPSTSHAYQVVAFDAAGNLSTASTPATGTTLSGGGGTNVTLTFRGTSPLGEGTASAAATPVAATQSGDTMLATVTATGSSTITAPSGWTQVGSTSHDTTSIALAAFTKTASASETTPYTFSSSGASSVQAAITSTTPWVLNTSASSASSSTVNTSPTNTVSGLNQNDEVFLLAATTAGPRPYPDSGCLFGIMPNPADWSTETDHNGAGLATLDGIAGVTIAGAHSMYPWDCSSGAGNAQFSKAGNPPATCYTNSRIFYGSWPRPRDPGSDVNTGETSNQWTGVFGSGDPTPGLQAIAAGTYDSIIDGNANAYKAWGHPFICRMFWEMEAGGVVFDAGQASSSNLTGGASSPYAVAFIAAWQRIVTRTRAICGNQVLFHWNRDNFQATAITADQLDPGSAYVDLYGCEGYIHCSGTWDSLMKASGAGGKSFTPIYQEYSKARPLANGEGGPQFQNAGCSTETDSAAAARIQSYQTYLPSYPDWKDFNWWNGSGPNGDSRIDHLGSASQTAFANWLQTAYMTPRLDRTWLGPLGAPWQPSFEHRWTIHPKSDAGATATNFGAAMQGAAMWHQTNGSSTSLSAPALPTYGWGRHATLTIVATPTGNTGGGGGGQGYVQNLGSAVDTTLTTTVTMTTIADVPAGNHIVVSYGGSLSGVSLTSTTITDSVGLSWAGNTEDDGTRFVGVKSANCPSLVPAGTTITATFPQATTRKVITADELTGIKTSAYSDNAFGANSGVGPNMTTGSNGVVTSQANSLNFAAFYSEPTATATDGDWAPGPGYTQAGPTTSLGTSTPFGTLWTEYEIVSTQGAQSASVTSTLGAINYVAVLDVLKAATAGTSDTTAPTAPTSVTATALSSTSIQVTWSGATDNVGVTSYQLLRGGVQIASPTSSPFTDTGLSPNTSYTYTVKAVDAAGNVSVASSGASATTLTGGGGAGSGWVRDLGVTSASGSATTLVITLTANSDLGDSVILSASASGKAVTSVADSKGNTYTIDATEDAQTPHIAIARAPITSQLLTGDTITITYAGSTGGLCAYAGQYTGLSASPVDKTQTLGSAAGTSATITNASANAQASELVIAGWVLNSGGSAPVAGTGYTLRTTSLSSPTIHTLGQEDKTVSSIETSSASLSWTGSVTASACLVTYKLSGTADTTPPTAPPSLTAKPTSSTSIALNWAPATDNVAVAGYQVLRGATLIGSTSSLSFTDSGLSPNTSYTYTVKAFDAAGNISSASPSATATTPSGVANGTLKAYINHARWMVNCPICNDAGQVPPGTRQWVSPTCGTLWNLQYPTQAVRDANAIALAMRTVSQENWDSTLTAADLKAQDQLTKTPLAPPGTTDQEVNE